MQSVPTSAGDWGEPQKPPNERALRLTQQEPERRFLEGRLRELAD